MRTFEHPGVASDRRRWPSIGWRLALVWLALSESACRRGEDPRGARKVDATRTYSVRGVVRAVDEAAGLLTVRHEAIKGFMAAMTMPFEVANDADRAFLKDVRPGDTIEATLNVHGDSAVLTNLEIVEFAQAPAVAPTGSSAPARLTPGQPVPDFAFTTQDGEKMHLKAYRGQVVVLTFIYTRCPLPNFCPAMDRKFHELAKLLGAIPSRAAGVRLLSMSFDPEHDTPEVLKTHADRQGARPPLWSFAVASHEELARVAPMLGLSYGPGKNEVIHSRSTAIIAPDGRLVRLDLGGDWTPASFLAEITRTQRLHP